MEIKNGIIIEAKLITETPKAWYLNCEGDKVWFPKNLCRFDHKKQELEAPKWFMQNKFPNESF